MLQTIPLAASDLFFLVDNRDYWKLLEHSEEDALEALEINAKDFCYSLESLGISLDYAEVVQDYLDRV